MGTVLYQEQSVALITKGILAIQKTGSMVTRSEKVMNLAVQQLL